MSSPRDNEIVNQNTDEEVAKVTTLLGATNNTGGSATAGTVMAKLNGIFTNASTAATKATAAAADAAAAKANTATNNTASKTGVLSQKLAYVIGLLENATYGLSALKTAVTGGSAVAKAFKSCNRYVYYNKGGVAETSFTIKKVDPSSCIVLVEMIANAGAKAYDYEYTLSATSIAISHGTYTNDGYSGLIFTVVELY